MAVVGSEASEYLHDLVHFYAYKFYFVIYYSLPNCCHIALYAILPVMLCSVPMLLLEAFTVFSLISFMVAELEWLLGVNVLPSLELFCDSSQLQPHTFSVVSFLRWSASIQVDL
jgi:hypothetical protein